MHAWSDGPKAGAWPRNNAAKSPARPGIGRGDRLVTVKRQQRYTGECSPGSASLPKQCGMQRTADSRNQNGN